jgi:hypothetical protein
MFIVMKDGPKKGEIQEMKYFIARDLIIAGRAEQYRFAENVDPAKEPTVKSYSASTEGLQSLSAPIAKETPASGKKKKK